MSERERKRDNPERLSSPQREQLEEILLDEAALSGRLDARVPGEVLLRVNAQMIAAMQHPRRRLVPLWVGSGVAAAAAACLLLAAYLHVNVRPERPAPEMTLSAQEAAEAFVAPAESPLDVEIDLLHDQLASAQQDLTGTNESALQMQIDAVDQDMRDFWLDTQGSSTDNEAVAD